MIRGALPPSESGRLTPGLVSILLSTRHVPGPAVHKAEGAGSPGADAPAERDRTQHITPEVGWAGTTPPLWCCSQNVQPGSELQEMEDTRGPAA